MRIIEFHIVLYIQCNYNSIKAPFILHSKLQIESLSQGNISIQKSLPIRLVRIQYIHTYTSRRQPLSASQGRAESSMLFVMVSRTHERRKNGVQ